MAAYGVTLLKGNYLEQIYSELKKGTKHFTNGSAEIVYNSDFIEGSYREIDGSKYIKRNIQNILIKTKNDEGPTYCRFGSALCDSKSPTFRLLYDLFINQSMNNSNSSIPVGNNSNSSIPVGNNSNSSIPVFEENNASNNTEELGLNGLKSNDETTEEIGLNGPIPEKTNNNPQ